ncbi:MAG: DUF5916 domain-containing protein [Bacteroidetes bacterium]|nr:DUF5916 domain-containing protein [Bacteroidota bacterium]
MTKYYFVLLLVSFLTGAQPVLAQYATFSDHEFRSDKPVLIQRMNGAIAIDGKVNEAAWQEITPIPFHVYDPSYGAPASQKTEFRVAYDDQFVYFSCVCFDSEPDKIAQTTFKRDAWESNYDQVALMLDTFNDKENNLLFIVSAAGVRIDVAILNDAQGEAPYNIPWNAFWDAETSVGSHGWDAEIRVPLSSLRFNSSNDVTKMGLGVYRYLSRANEMHLYPERRKTWGFFSLFKPSIAQEVVFERIEPKRATYITPYLLGGSSRSNTLNDAETAYEQDSGPTFDVGLDVKVGLTSNLTLDLTANTDFAQVEADDQQINLTRFSLFFPEQRLFFQERSTNFELNFGQSNRLFYTRQIGINDEELVPLLGGAKIVGKVGSWDVGVLNMQSGRQNGLPAENFGVVRLRRQVLNANSFAGGIVTTRIGEKGGQNIGLGIDGIVRLRGEDYLSLAAVHTFDEEVERGFDATRLRAHLRREATEGFRYSFEFNRAGIDYRPDMGFEMREDYTEAKFQGGWGRLGKESDRLKRIEGFAYTDVFVGNSTQQLQTRESTIKGTIQTWTDFTVELQASRWTENLDEAFELSDKIEIPVDRYTYNEVKITATTWGSKAITSTNFVVLGQFFDGNRFTIQTAPKWNVSKVLELSGSYQFDHVKFATRQETFDAHTMRLKVGLTFNRRFSVSSFVQYGSDADFLLGNFRLRFNPKEGNDFYLVYNEGIHTDRFAKDPIAPRLSGRTLLLKYSYTFIK